MASALFLEIEFAMHVMGLESTFRYDNVVIVIFVLDDITQRGLENFNASPSFDMTCQTAQYNRTSMVFMIEYVHEICYLIIFLTNCLVCLYSRALALFVFPLCTLWSCVKRLVGKRNRSV